jgi:hypothetical protein
MAGLDLSLSCEHLLPLQSVLTPPCGLHGGSSTVVRAGGGAGGGRVTIPDYAEAEDNHRTNRIEQAEHADATLTLPSQQRGSPRGNRFKLWLCSRDPLPVTREGSDVRVDANQSTMSPHLYRSYMDTRTRVTWLIYGMTNAVLFGVGLVTILLIRPLADRAFVLIPVVVIVSFALAYPVAWWIVPWLRARNERRRSMMR